MTHKAFPRLTILQSYLKILVGLFVKCKILVLFRSLARNCALRMCAITFPRGSLHTTFHIIFHIWPIPNISIIFCRRGSVGAGLPRGFYQLIKVLRKETGQAIRGPVGAQQQLHSSTAFWPSSNLWIWIEGSIQSLDGWPHPLFCSCPAKKVRWAECREKAARACLSVSVLAEEKIRFSRTSSCNSVQ